MDLSNLKPAKGSINKNSKRIGRGQGSGKGGTATRGHKGAKSRSGYSKKLDPRTIVEQFFQSLVLRTLIVWSTSHLI